MAEHCQFLEAKLWTTGTRVALSSMWKTLHGIGITNLPQWSAYRKLLFLLKALHTGSNCGFVARNSFRPFLAAFSVDSRRVVTTCKNKYKGAMGNEGTGKPVSQHLGEWMTNQDDELLPVPTGVVEGLQLRPQSQP